MNGDIKILKDDVRDVRDRILKLEETVRHLPSKMFIVTTIITCLTVFGAILSVAIQFQTLARPVPQSAPQSRAGAR